ncbi:hypothetical protein [Ethanoligenens sp.]|uniref:hypothetical protein n=1 Tax=Ethanoligenens sp. TaxID=2099655 RepID=UPI0039E741FB
MKIKRIRGKPKFLFKSLFLIILVVLICTTLVSASGTGANLWPGGRIGYRLDTHYGQVAANAPAIPLYNDPGCTQPINHYLLPGDWVVAYFNSDGSFTGAVTYPITVPQNGGSDDGLEYTTHYIHPEHLSYIVSGVGNFTGTDWNQTTWFNHLPTNIGYTSKLPGNGDTVWVGNNTDGGVGGGFNVAYAGNGYYRLFSGDYSSSVMSPTLTQYCYYDDSHTDYVNADYSWSRLFQPWNTSGLHQGYNLISYAGMDASGNYTTGQRYLWWDTLAPDMATNLNAIQCSTGHHGWLNLSDFNGGGSYIIVSRDDTSQTTDVSGLNLASLQTVFDGVNQFGNSAGYQGFDYNDGTNWVKSMSLHSTMQAMGVQNDGAGGQGTHSFQFSSIDNAWNTAVIGASVQIDTIPPTCTVSSGASNWQSATAPITLDFEDPGSTNGTGSGVATAQYSWSQSQTDTGTWQNYTAGGQLTPPGDGTWYLHWQATDVAGNSASGVFGPYSNSAGLAVSIQTPNAAYLTDTDVVTSAIVADNSPVAVLPSDSVTLKLTVSASDGSTYITQTKGVVVPGNDKNLIWFRWHTPSTPGTYTLTATAASPSVPAQSGWTSTLKWIINAPTESTPPQPKLYDKAPPYFSIQTPASSGYFPSLTWNEWTYTGGAFQKETFTANLSAALKITPEMGEDGQSRIETATQDSNGVWTMKSGYGINETATGNVSVTSGTGSQIKTDSTTLAQLTEGRYPEFNYWSNGYFRLFQNNGSGNFTLRPNKYSVLNLPVHYTPVWFPDGPYTAQATISQAWTPAGMLGDDATDTMQIKGALPQDWYVRVFK